jgi:tripeptidyl-peptidase-1
VAVDIKMHIRHAFSVISTLCGLVLPASGARGDARDRISRGIPPSHVIHERHEHHHVEGWVKRELVDAQMIVPVRIGLQQSNVDAGHELLMDM